MPDLASPGIALSDTRWRHQRSFGALPLAVHQRSSFTTEAPARNRWLVRHAVQEWFVRQAERTSTQIYISR